MEQTADSKAHEIADFFQSFTADQSKAFEEICQSIHNGDDHVLEGFAGTGKTYLCQGLEYEFPDIIFTAPTNKAVKVLEEKTGAVCTTIHKLLKLKLDKGKLVQHGTPELRGIVAVVVDECSMVSEEIMKLIELYIPCGLPVIYIGDPAQLPPVHEELSRSFETKNKSRLDKIVRQAEGNEIIAFSKRIREETFDVDEIPTDAKAIKIQPYKKRFKLMEHAVGKDTIYCAWTNKTVYRMNFYLHKFLYGKDSTDFCKGEEIVLAAPLIDNITGEILAGNGDTFIVKDIKKSSYRGYECWEIHTENAGFVIRTPTREGKIKIDEKLDEWVRKKAWYDFYRLKETFADVRHTYAFTCHKLQGTTVKNVVIDVPDMLKNRDCDELDKLLYVAVTRASNKAIFLI